MPTKILMYDSECAYCRGFVRLVYLLDRPRQIFTIPFDEPNSQVLLRAQFGENHGFDMYFFEQQEVSWGREAARRIVRVVSLPRWMARLAFLVYPSLVKLISKLTRRTRAVCGPDCSGLINQIQQRESATTEETALRALREILGRRTPQPS
ncbi:MAG: hypothetical protein A2Z21_06240 [Candidatus Fraserbacteria bacterium RBG_16_55_9]|uniref:DUF393 domain-containing protein n=1 Tax=Fraserbacteria sp. (strain RBG_16_55_9) TaxID=1817864 RepID=A0A1F5USW9_FRAXR|nr:MAG: hypothetical protein A2Z21_06240 [Candidatus Fraserbacteria bacterium RBG_16_55_9]